MSFSCLIRDPDEHCTTLSGGESSFQHALEARVVLARRWGITVVTQRRLPQRYVIQEKEENHRLQLSMAVSFEK